MIQNFICKKQYCSFVTPILNQEHEYDEPNLAMGMYSTRPFKRDIGEHYSTHIHSVAIKFQDWSLEKK